jgi:hypothetical protein
LISGPFGTKVELRRVGDRVLDHLTAFDQIAGEHVDLDVADALVTAPVRRALRDVDGGAERQQKIGGTFIVDGDRRD